MMEAENAGAEARRWASAEHEDAAAREQAADERQRVAEQLEHLANEREREADRRERRADQREAVADERERKADERERAADVRQHLADKRERELAERERRSSSGPPKRDRQALEFLDRARVLLALSAERLDRQEAGVRRDIAGRKRQQADVDRASAEGERGLIGSQQDPEELIQRRKALRKQTRRSIRAMLTNEEEIARTNEELAASDPDRRAQYRAIAKDARDAAREAREVLRSFAD